ncbi:hypothetical protein JCM33374_g459 [Metschnikowia sp. JCM 33374]|nr:hypothetical protein JCM33374_g459 [Metschnikowia sp. JCM 33374]
MHQPLTPQNSNPDIASLATLGMRIRKAVAEGHAGGSRYSYNPNWSFDRPQNEQSHIPSDSQPRNLFERTPLPAHMSQPPPLTNAGSTFQSGSNVSEWGAPSVNVTTLPQMGTKRKLDDDSDDNMGYSDFKQYDGYNGYNPSSGFAGNFTSWEEFTQKNGSLKFDEDF